VSSDNLLKGFGVGADVVGQLSTSKALRRKSTGTVSGFDITDGELYEGVAANGKTIPHSLGRVPTGCTTLSGPANALIVCTDKTARDITVSSNTAEPVILWIV